MINSIKTISLISSFTLLSHSLYCYQAEQPASILKPTSTKYSAQREERNTVASNPPQALMPCTSTPTLPKTTITPTDSGKTKYRQRREYRISSGAL